MKISALPNAISITGSEVVPIVQGGVTKQATLTTVVAGSQQVNKTQTRSDLAALTSTSPSVLMESGKEGLFVWSATNHWDGVHTPIPYDGTSSISYDSTNVGYTITKTSGTNSWYTVAKDNVSFLGDFEIWCKRGPTTVQGIAVGLDTHVANTIAFTDVPWLLNYGTGVIDIYQSGVKQTNVALSNTTNWLCIKRVGNSLSVYENALIPSVQNIATATLKATFSTTSSAPLYLKVLAFGVGDTQIVEPKDLASAGTGWVQSDPKQAVYVAPNSDTTGRSGAWVRVTSNNNFAPEWFGAVGDGSTNDTDAFYAASVFLTKLNSGTLALGANKTYVVGKQTFQGDPANYSYAPAHIIYLTGFSGNIKIEGNGSTLKAAAGLRIGSFDPSTGVVYNPPAGGFSNTTYVASPYTGMIHAVSYTGSLTISNLILDGNESNLTKGGYWGDTGFQIPCGGLQILPGTGKLQVNNLTSTRHGTDGATYQATIDSRMHDTVQARFTSCDFTYNGRNGFSLTGGRGVIFEGCKFNHTSKGSIQTNPQYGFDNEPDAALYSRDVTFINCEFLNNNNGGYGGGSGRMQEINFYDCRFSGDPSITGATSIALYITKPGHKLHNCKIAGFYQITALDAVKYEFREGIYEEGWGTQFFSCIFTNNPNEYYGGIAPTFGGGAPLASGPILFESCIWDYNVVSWTASTAVLKDQVLKNGGKYYRCTTAGTTAASVGPTGTGTGITDGTAVWTYAGDRVSMACDDSGSDPYRVTHRNCTVFDDANGGVTNVGGNWHGVIVMNYETGKPAVNTSPSRIYGRYIYNNVEQFVGSKTFDWPSIAAGASSSTTVTVPLANLGDGRVYQASMSNGFGGLISFAYASAANTVTVVAFNPTGSPIDLASGTLSVIGVR